MREEGARKKLHAAYIKDLGGGEALVALAPAAHQVVVVAVVAASAAGSGHRGRGLRRGGGCGAGRYGRVAA